MHANDMKMFDSFKSRKKRERGGKGKISAALNSTKQVLQTAINFVQLLAASFSAVLDREPASKHGKVRELDRCRIL